MQLFSTALAGVGQEWLGQRGGGWPPVPRGISKEGEGRNRRGGAVKNGGDAKSKGGDIFT